ncbi:hypothetical protein [Streptomyces sp. NPDC059761]|uniref:hypothetical protein n=1 Tax=Streptomyces sp. NPDC059761 TaxID=3346937 RepID=UPI00364D6EEE
MSNTALVPTYDFEKAAVALRHGNQDLGQLLAELATIPAPKQQSIAVPAVIERLGESLMDAVTRLPLLFGHVKPPKTRRTLNKTELTKLALERNAIDTAIKALTERKTEIAEMVSQHFDVVAENRGTAKPEETPRDKKGHYLISSPGSREEAPLDGTGQFFTRERTADKADFSESKLKKLYEAGTISRADYLACTEPVKGRRISEDKLRAMLVSPKRRARAAKILGLISDVKRGTNSINLRGSAN